MPSRFTTLLRARAEVCAEYRRERVRGDCQEYRDDGRDECSGYRDDGEDRCAEWGEQCCDWQPCKAFCRATVWVCTSWVWVSNWVCVGWYWVANLVCVAWAWTTYSVCVAWAVPSTAASILLTTRPEFILRPRAIRLTFAYEGLNLTLVSQQRLEMTVPPSDVLRDLLSYSGFWYELRDGRGNALYRYVMHSPIRKDVEVFPAGPDEGFSRRPVANASGVFSVLFPDVPGARRLVFYSSPLDEMFRPAEVFADFEISGSRIVNAPSV